MVVAAANPNVGTLKSADVLVVDGFKEEVLERIFVVEPDAVNFLIDLVLPIRLGDGRDVAVDMCRMLCRTGRWVKHNGGQRGVLVSGHGEDKMAV